MDLVEISIIDIAENILVNVTEINESVSVTPIGISAAAVTVGTPTTAVAVNTTVQNTIELSYQSAATTTASTFQIGVIELIK